MRRRRLLLRRRAAAALAALTLAAGVAPSTASAATIQTESSGNWAGYVATGRTFSGVSGSWVVPTAKRDSDGYSATWIGLGGASGSSNALEQIGTQSNYVNSRATYTAWYELVPKAAVTLKLTVHPGDHISAHVTVDGTAVTASITDTTTGRSTTKTLNTANPDTTSAEWIAEAPSIATGDGEYQVVPLADFGTVSFTRASATADGHSGSIADAHWTAERVDLASRGGESPVAASSRAEATTSALASSGSSFSVSWSQTGGAYDYGAWPHDHGPGF
jgi:Peptidase A4 family